MESDDEAEARQVAALIADGWKESDFLAAIIGAAATPHGRVDVDRATLTRRVRRYARGLCVARGLIKA